MILIYCFKMDPLLADVLPLGYETWVCLALDILNECTPLSPTIARDAKVAGILGDKLLKDAVGVAT